MPTQETWEHEVSTSTGEAIAKIMRRLPEIWLARRRAERLAKTLPSFAGDVPLPPADAIAAWIEDLCQTDHRRPGTPEGQRAESWVADRFGEFGLEQVTMDPIPITVWAANKWSLTVAGQATPSFYVINTAFTPPEGLTAPLAYVGTGAPEDFARVAAKGKIVVADVPFPRMPTGMLMKLLRAGYFLSDPDGSISWKTNQYLNFVRRNFIGGVASAEAALPNDVYWRAVREGAAGICLILRDQPSNSNTHYGPYDGMMKPIPGLWIGKYDGAALRRQAKTGAFATLKLEGSAAPGTMRNVWGVLPGRSAETILVTSHHDSPFKGAVEDGAGVAQVLAQAAAWSQVPREQRPRTLVFVVDAGHFYGSEGGRDFARRHADIMKRTRILITLEHLGGKEVAERDRQYVATGRVALTVMFTSSEPRTIASAIKALAARPAKRTVSIPADLIAPVPTSDAVGYLVESRVPVVSWIGCPYYLLDEHDTLDKIAVDELAPISRTVAELIRIHMALA